ncbi:unnamed protein product [Cylicocyclus nassatus]|uniref:Uncharacterized protein n=1 Tax=Cylicocyclus nassatus TaxID=53992 RepID=A0AA36DPJ8_CYLNA|nr:unnamed protein product [Cylicocyclus nassatus]
MSALDIRKEQYQEALQNRVMNEFVRIINLPTSQKKDFNIVLDELLVILGYDKEREHDYQPLSWPRPAGVGAVYYAIQAKMTYNFWQFFCKSGKNRLNEYNAAHGTKIVFIQEKSMKQTDQNKLCLYLRNKIKDRYAAVNKRPIDIKIRKAKIEIGSFGAFDPVILARRLEWDYSDWAGLPFDEILDLKIKKDEEAGNLHIGKLTLPGLEEKEKENVQPSCSYSETVVRGVKRSKDNVEPCQKKRKD